MRVQSLRRRALLLLLLLLLQRTHAAPDERLGALLLALRLLAGLARRQADVEADGHDGRAEHPLDRRRVHRREPMGEIRDV